MTENKFDYRKILSKYSIVLVLIVIMIACTFANSSFLTANNLINVCRQQSVIIILAFGEMILIICGQLVQKFLNKWTIFLFCSILFSSNQKEH